MKKNEWLVVADASHARIFRYENAYSLTEIATLDHPKSRLHNLDLVSDKPGREFPRMGGGSRSAVQSSVTPQKHEFELFAREIIHYLLKAYNEKKLESFHLAAGPEFLGLIRSFMPAELRKIISGETNKTLTEFKTKDIIEHLLN